MHDRQCCVCNNSITASIVANAQNLCSVEHSYVATCKMRFCFRVSEYSSLNESHQTANQVEWHNSNTGVASIDAGPKAPCLRHSQQLRINWTHVQGTTNSEVTRHVQKGANLEDRLAGNIAIFPIGISTLQPDLGDTTYVVFKILTQTLTLAAMTISLSCACA